MPSNASTRGRGTRWGGSWIYWAGGAILAGALIVLFVRPHHAVSAPAFPFPCLAQETLDLHLHPYLRITVDGQPVSVPAAIGIGNPQFEAGMAVGGSCFEPLHTHDASGIIHIEGPDPARRYALADFFAVWRATYETVEIGGRRFPVTYTATELLGHQSGAGRVIRLLVDGRSSEAGPGLQLNALDYCNARTATPPCYPTAVGDPFPPVLLSSYGTGHTIVLEYR